MATHEEHRSLRDRTVADVRELIVTGKLAPGNRLVERTLAAALGVSRVPVREALRALEREGFVEERPTRGMVVRRLDDDEVEMLFTIRGALDAVICRRLLAVLDDEGLADLQTTVDDAAQALASGDRPAAVRANSAFHERMVALSDSRVLEAVVDPIAGRLRWLLGQHDDPAPMIAEHQQILDALRSGGARRAIRACAAHLETSRATLHAMRPESDGAPRRAGP